jgi:glycine cleavage system H protein
MVGHRFFGDGDMSFVKYTKDHEWIRVEDDTGVVGITEYAQEQLGDVVFVELPEAGRAVEAGKETAVVESVKAASEIFAPVSGEVVEVNEALASDPALVNRDPMGEGWFLRIRIDDKTGLDDLMDAAAYGEYVEGLR